MGKYQYTSILTLALLLVANVACNREKETTSLTDERDGTVYELFTYGNKTWMAENLKFDAGDKSWVYDDDPSNIENYGRLYEWGAAAVACPEGWRLPTHQELTLLINNLGGNEVAGEVLKAKNHLSLVKGGFRFPEGTYDAMGDHGVYWTETEIPENEAPYQIAWIVAVFSFDDTVDQTGVNKQYGFSVRCVKE